MQQERHIRRIGILAGLAVLMGGFFSADASEKESFAERAAGTYFVQFDIGGGAFLPAVATLHEDRTLISIDATDGGIGPQPQFFAPNVFVNTPILSNWKRTGRRTVVAKGIFLNFLKPDDPSLGGTIIHGILAAISKTTTVIRFDRRFREIHGLVCEQRIPVMNGTFDPVLQSLENFPDIECTPKTPGVAIFPFTGKRIR